MNGLYRLPQISLKARVAAALSGGVDSSVTAALLIEAGYDVVGVTMLLHDQGTAEDASRVAGKLGIEHHVVDLRESFSRIVMDDFADTYLAGETPNPCVRCNKRIKFGALMDWARAHGAEALATGHYARRVIGAGGPELHVAADARRDQSYFLYALSREQLAFAQFPLGDIQSKGETRKLAEHFDLPVAWKPDSQDICFVPDGDYVAVLNRLRPEACLPGDIVDTDGRMIGHHDGIIHFTVGQRRGLNIGDRRGENNEPLFVIRLDAESRRVVVGPREALARKEVLLRNVNWLAEPVSTEGIEVMARLRSAQKPVPARFYPSDKDDGRLVLGEPAVGVAAGQSAVAYRDGRVLGGGIIRGRGEG